MPRGCSAMSDARSAFARAPSNVRSIPITSPVALHLRPEVGIDADELRHREHGRLDRHQVPLGPQTAFVALLPQCLAEHRADGELHHGHAGDLREERDGPAGARIHLEDEHARCAAGLVAAGRRTGCSSGRWRPGQERCARCSREWCHCSSAARCMRRVHGHRVPGVHAGSLDVLHDSRNEDASRRRKWRRLRLRRPSRILVDQDRLALRHLGGLRDEARELGRRSGRSPWRGRRARS